MNTSLFHSRLSRALIAAATLLLLLTACGENTKDSGESADGHKLKEWWVSRVPDLVIEKDEFHVRDCSITHVATSADTRTAEAIFKVPSRLLTVCENSKSEENPLQFDGQFIILGVCQTTLGAGGCAGERYRSADFENWEEYIGITWIEGEKYEAWRRMGSTSSRADSVKKVDD